MGGDLQVTDYENIKSTLKSTPPAWAGTKCSGISKSGTSLNPPRPHGRGRKN